MTKIPLLILSDAISSGTGLGRIAHDLAANIHNNLSDIYRVGTYGYGGPGTAELSIPQYNIEGMDEWVCPSLAQVWKDFADTKQKGIVFTIWDLSRLGWFAQPVLNRHLFKEKVKLLEFIKHPPFEKWAYVPLDADGPNGQLTFPLMRTLIGYDNILAYTNWGARVIDKTLGYQTPKTDDLPHGIDGSVFYQRDRLACRAEFVHIVEAIDDMKNAPPIAPTETLIGIVATNQMRKDWGIGIETAARLSKSLNVRLWIHTDLLERWWSIPALLVDFGILDKTIISLGHIPDDNMAKAYSACDLVFGIGAEGFGYPHAESLSCGTPCITGDFAGGAEIVPPEMRVEPRAFRYEGVWTSRRPVYDVEDWQIKAIEWHKIRVKNHTEYHWSRVWPRWEQFFRERAARWA